MQPYMLSEIKEEPQIIKKLLNLYIENSKINITIPKNIKHLRIIASGSSYHCASILTYLFKKYTSLDVNCDYSSEFILKEHFRYNETTFYIFISQSGETTDTIYALKKVKEKNIKNMAITNVENSTITKEADYYLLTHAGIENSIAATKSLLAQIFCLYLILLKFIKIEDINITEYLNHLYNLSEYISKIQARQEEIETIAEVVCQFDNIVVLGNRFYYSIALEGALKIKETCYININAYPLGEFVHGHLATLNNKSAIIALIDEKNLENNLKILEKINNEYNPTIITISPKPEISVSDFNFEIPFTSEVIEIFSLIVFFQLLAFKTAKKLDRNIDNPKGLKKVVLE